MPLNNPDFGVIDQFRKIGYGLIFAIGVVLLVIGIKGIWDAHYIREAVVVDKEYKPQEATSGQITAPAKHNLSLEFRDSRKKKKNCTVTLDKLDWMRIPQGAKIKIFYDHSRPADKRVFKVQIGANPFPSQYFYTVGGIILCLWGGILLRKEQDAL